MTCPRHEQLLGQLAGNLPSSAVQDLQEHLAGCTVCRSALAELQASWDPLGQWEVDDGGLDLTGRILAGAGDLPALRPAGRGRAFRGVAFRAAASLTMAIGLGLGGGYLLSRSSAGPAGPPITLGGLDAALGWLELSAGSVTGLDSDMGADGADGVDDAATGGATP